MNFQEELKGLKVSEETVDKVVKVVRASIPGSQNFPFDDYGFHVFGPGISDEDFDRAAEAVGAETIDNDSDVEPIYPSWMQLLDRMNERLLNELKRLA